MDTSLERLEDPPGPVEAIALLALEILRQVLQACDEDVAYASDNREGEFDLYLRKTMERTAACTNDAAMDLMFYFNSELATRRDMVATLYNIRARIVAKYGARADTSEVGHVRRSAFWTSANRDPLTGVHARAAHTGAYPHDLPLRIGTRNGDYFLILEGEHLKRYSRILKERTPSASPQCKHSSYEEIETVENAQSEALLAKGLADSLDAFELNKIPRRPKPERELVRLVSDWLVPGLSVDDRRRVEGQVIRTDALFWRSPDAPYANIDAMRRLFDGVARVLSETGNLNEELLKSEIPALVLDSAIGAGWYAPEMAQKDICPDQLWHYWAQRVDRSDGTGLFYRETAEWLAWLRENAKKEIEDDAPRTPNLRGEPTRSDRAELGRNKIGAQLNESPGGEEQADRRRARSKGLDEQCASKGRTSDAGIEGPVPAQDQRGPGKDRSGKKPVRRTATYEGIDRALPMISAARPKNHEEVFRFLDERKVDMPGRKPFRTAGGWLKGFQQNRPAASAWLSQVWGRLDLPAFARGPKK